MYCFIDHFKNFQYVILITNLQIYCVHYRHDITDINFPLFRGYKSGS